MAGSAKVTIDHDEIRRWVEERGGCPARVKATGEGEDPGIIRIDYTGFSGVTSLERIGWDDWFRAFEENQLALLHQDRKNGRVSRFSKLVRREHAAGQPTAKQEPIDAVSLLKEQHDLVRALFSEIDRDAGAMNDLIDNLAIHLEIEELVLYPMLRMIDLASEMYRAVEEHLAAKRLVADLVRTDLDDDTRDAKLEMLRREVIMHLDEEERVVFPALASRLDRDELHALGQELVGAMVRLIEEGEEAPVEAVLSQTDPV